MRLPACFLVLAVVAGAQVSVAVQPQYNRVNSSIMDLNRMAKSGASPQQLNQGVTAMMSGFQGLQPMTGSFTAADHQANRQLIQNAMGSLAALEVMARQDPALRGTLAGAYGTLGDYQARREFRNYGYNPVMPYGRASSLARGLAMRGYADRDYNRDLERYAMGMATWNIMNGYIWAGMGARGRNRQDEEPEVPVPTPPERHVMPVPQIDASSLSAEDKALWEDLRPQFVVVSSKITEAMRNLDSLSARLQARRMDVNAADLATSYRMQGYLEDAAELIKSKDLAGAKLALERAEYERKRLRGVTGQ